MTTAKMNRTLSYLLLGLGIALLLFVFYYAYYMLGTVFKAFETTEVQVISRGESGEIKIPGVAAMSIVLEVIVAGLLLFVMAFAASAIAAKGVGLLKG